MYMNLSTCPYSSKVRRFKIPIWKSLCQCHLTPFHRGKKILDFLFFFFLSFLTELLYAHISKGICARAGFHLHCPCTPFWLQKSVLFCLWLVLTLGTCFQGIPCQPITSPALTLTAIASAQRCHADTRPLCGPCSSSHLPFPIEKRVHGSWRKLLWDRKTKCLKDTVIKVLSNEPAVPTSVGTERHSATGAEVAQSRKDRRDGDQASPCCDL